VSATGALSRAAGAAYETADGLERYHAYMGWSASDHATLRMNFAHADGTNVVFLRKGGRRTITVYGPGGARIGQFHFDGMRAAVRKGSQRVAVRWDDRHLGYMRTLYRVLSNDLLGSTTDARIEGPIRKATIRTPDGDTFEAWFSIDDGHFLAAFLPAAGHGVLLEARGFRQITSDGRRAIVAWNVRGTGSVALTKLDIRSPITDAELDGDS
jgi:hypothetical protein